MGTTLFLETRSPEYFTSDMLRLFAFRVRTLYRNEGSMRTIKNQDIYDEDD